jgi:hypothetical protein
MKKITILTIACLALSLVSCKKYYTCECCSTGGGTSTCVSGTSSTKMKKKDAESECNQSYSSGGYTTECKLK